MHIVDTKILNLSFNRRNRSLPLGMLLFYCIGLCAWLSSGQTVPILINYQGQISNPDGTPPATGDYELSFSIYDAPKDGILIWGPQTFGGANGPGLGPKIPVVQGFFNTSLGPVDTLGRSLSTAFSNSLRFVEIKVGKGAPIIPRQQFLSSPFALRAELAGQVASGSISAQHLAKDLTLDVLIPPGTILPFGGSVIPEGWLACGGDEIPRLKYSRLFKAISTSWGAGDGVLSFHLPDLRGLFLRGVNGGRVGEFSDPDLGDASRTNIHGGGATGNQVGSYQRDAFERHTHKPFDVPIAQSFSFLAAPSDVYVPAYGPGVFVNNLPSSGAAGQSQETRPKNAYVNYIIKY